MRDIREVAERLGYARAKYEQGNQDILVGKLGSSEIAAYWAQEMVVLEWVLGDERTAYPIVAKELEVK